ncbi:Transcriptional repressor scratch 1-like protein [Leptotrombidium deliense]|uniref:Transcriptional repressor scratch 1-like protein n=1 Tax=Leptotrombidium deliense TaxID=299467 RepID=A0A443SGQ5_9ACAR|nr:Transcriptional repressor scratch 1-like protein [Leptotrombidium deliense]
MQVEAQDLSVKNRCMLNTDYADVHNMARAACHFSDLTHEATFVNLSGDSLVEYSSCSSNSDSVDAFATNGCDNHICGDCGKRYSTSSNLARHRQTHRSVNDKKARKCPHCDKVYVSMPAYSMHVRTHSQGCQCPYCGKCFSRPWLLQGHIRTHTGEKPFKCPICSKAFADKSNLRAHIQTHSTTKPYSCQRCGKAFALKSYLYKHEESSCMRVHKSSTGALEFRNRVSVTAYNT